jgi:hypothetical protein
MQSKSSSHLRRSLPLLAMSLLTAGAAGAQVIVPNLLYTTVVPCRILDTRLATSGRLVANTVRTFNVVGNTTGAYFTSQGGQSGGCSVPGFQQLQGEAAPRPLAATTPDAVLQGAPQVQAVVINLAVVNAAGPGFLNAWPTDHGMPFSSLINYTVGTTVANQVVLAVRQDTQGADISVVAAVSGTHLIGDIVGYFSSGSVIQTSQASTGEDNLYIGPSAGNQLSSLGNNNVGLGASALASLQGGSANVAVGVGAMGNATNPTNNIAIGEGALLGLSNGSNNIVIGLGAGANLTANESYNILVANRGVAGDNDVIRIGCGTGVCSHPNTAAFISGINGATTASGIPVYVDGNDQLGTLTSSLRFKQDVEDMGDATRGLMQLRPVTFRYKPAYDDGSHLLEYGLIAEEVATVYPELVQTDRSGKPLAVRTHFINAMMLNEVQRQHRTIAAQQERIDQQQTQIEELQRLVRALLPQRQPGQSTDQ